eukprot:5962847-Pyramimonas_sp.AAC.1
MLAQTLNEDSHVQMLTPNRLLSFNAAVHPVHATRAPADRRRVAAEQICAPAGRAIRTISQAQNVLGNRPHDDPKP